MCSVFGVVTSESAQEPRYCSVSGSEAPVCTPETQHHHKTTQINQQPRAATAEVRALGITGHSVGYVGLDLIDDHRTFQTDGGTQPRLLMEFCSEILFRF